eukprot:TRINITY_DN13710_c0_g1_i1.p1 TRINITY_DN13710_c0_g1~~TRINITY_DN13710_c0_g1_i1.p1  ORF type:complete len:203 (-),score=3.51 TRINITY_DN13710_c0_g1_i1:36-644(-)
MRAPVFSVLTSIISVTKIFFTVLVLLSNRSTYCDSQQLESWLILMMIHDILNLFTQFLGRYSDKLQRERESQALSMSNDELHLTFDSLVMDSSIYSSLLTHISRVKKIVSVLVCVTLTYFIILFVWGHFIYINHKQCTSQSPKEFLLLCLFLLLGYIYFVAIGLLVIIFLVCFLLFLILLSFFNAPTSVSYTHLTLPTIYSV